MSARADSMSGPDVAASSWRSLTRACLSVPDNGRPPDDDSAATQLAVVRTSARGHARRDRSNHQIRWPYVFVASFDDGLQVLNIMDPTNPYTVGFWDTQDGPDLQGINLQTGRRTEPMGPGNIYNGAWGVQVRNADGLILIADFKTGFWAFKMDGFDGWNGHQWGVPNISSAQDWDRGPDGAPKPQKVSRGDSSRPRLGPGLSPATS